MLYPIAADLRVAEVDRRVLNENIAMAVNADIEEDWFATTVVAPVSRTKAEHKPEDHRYTLAVVFAIC